MRDARTAHAVVKLADGKVLAAGGYDAGTRSTAELYDPATGRGRASAR